ncbi:hypothetical protein D3C76_1317630 [compost metagenome]
MLTGSHGDGTRNFDQRRIGFGARGGARGDIALHRAPRTLHGLRCANIRDRQGQGAFRHGGEGEGARAALLQLQSRPFQCRLQCTHGVVLALHRRRRLARSQCWIQGHGQTGLAGNLVQRGGQRTRGHVVAAHTGLFGSDQCAACQWGGQGDRHRQKAGAQKGFERAGHTTAPGKN